MTGKKSWSFRAGLGAATLMLVLILGLTQEQFSIVSHATSQCKVTASSVNIRKEPDAGSKALGSAEQGDSLTIKSQTKASDGTVWYQVFVNAQTLGYVRSDLVSITDGSTPAEMVPSTTTSTPSTSPSESVPESGPQAGVVEVEPVSASVKGGDRVRVRSLASTDSNIVKTVESGFALTVTGRVDGNDNYEWYQVEFISNGESVVGFIRSNYVELSGELVNAAEEVPEETAPPVEEETPEATVTAKDWDTQLQGEDWYLLNMVENGQYKIEDLFAAVETNKAAYEDSAKAVKSQKIVIILLVILVLALGGAVAFLIFKMKDMMDSAYFSRVEKDTLRRRNSRNDQSPQPKSKKVMHTVGGEKQPNEGRASQGDRPAQGRRPGVGTRPAGAAPQGGKPLQSRRPAEARPGGAAQQERPTRPPQAPAQGGKASQERSTGAPQGSRPAGMPSQHGPAGRQEAAKQAPEASQPRKSRNFIAEDDEFEFEFLNWEGEEE